MGLDIETARFLLGSKFAGTSYKVCATLGRQNYNLGMREGKNLLRDFGLDPNNYQKLVNHPYARDRFSEDFWEMLGTEELETIDASDFEGATCVHDLNNPIPEKLKRRFDAVCDFGTLEHIFDFQTAMRNCLEMVKIGGRFITATPANNYFGHGFYQFGPELYFRLFSEQNGFVVEEIIAAETGPRHRWFSVSDPATIKAKAALVNKYPVMLFVRARRTADKPLLATPPQQSDFQAQWDKEATPEQSGNVDALANPKFLPMKRMMLEWFPKLSRALEAIRFSSLSPSCSFKNRQAFKPVDKRNWGKQR